MIAQNQSPIQVVAGYVLLEWNSKDLQFIQGPNLESVQNIMQQRFNEVTSKIKYDEDLTYLDDMEAKIVDYDEKRYMWKISPVTTNFNNLLFNGPQPLVQRVMMAANGQL